MQAHHEPRSDGHRIERGAVEHRASSRVAAFGTSIQLGWWEGPTFRTVVGLLKDISRGGASALAEASPPAGTPLFIRLNGARLTEWLEATAVEVTKNRWFRRVPRLVRMQFHESCPYNFFQAAIDVLIMECGEAPADPNGRRTPHFADSKPRSGARRLATRSVSRWL